MDAFQKFAQEYAAYGYPVLFLGVLLENAGIPVPGETAVLVAGFLASPAGGGHFNILLVILLTFVAAVFGDNVGFWLGHRWARPRLQQRRRFLFLTPRALELAEGYFHRYGTWTIFFARFITGLRVVGALAAGTAGMPWPRFLLANAGGALTWAVVISLLGYFFGQSWELLHKWLGRGGLIVLACFLILVGLPVLMRRLHKMPTGLWERLVRAQIWQGVLAAVLEVVCIGVLVRLAEGEREPVIDKAVADWIESAGLQVPFLHGLAAAGGVVGTLVLTGSAALLMLGELAYRRRGWREAAALIWALAASEGIGLLLLALLRSRDIDPERALTWPFGFAGLVPIRAFAVYGMMAHLASRQDRRAGRIGMVLAAGLILLAGFSVVWQGEQKLSQMLLEWAAGGLILFGGIWWLEGYSSGLFPAPPTPTAAEVQPENPATVAPPRR
jgi:membrane protein DedA with SNARE-associated domain